jgi:LytS/YehU family sensor histidine kinase
VPLVEEIQLLQTYLELESLRFDNSFSFTIDSDEEIDIYETEIPILLVQPFVENAVLHAFQNTNEGIAREKHLNINFTEDHHHIICSIRDNGIGRAAARKLKDASISNRPSRGISVTEQRLAILYPKESHHDAVKIIDLTDSDGQPNGTEVVIKIPKE